MRTTSRVCWTVGWCFFLTGLTLTSERLSAQSVTELSRTLAAIASTPLGALTPIGPVMATSRDDTLLFGFRLQFGSRELSAQRHLTSYGFTTDLQVQGGALISGVIGYQHGDPEICDEASCDEDRMMAGLRYS